MDNITPEMIEMRLRQNAAWDARRRQAQAELAQLLERDRQGRTRRGPAWEHHHARVVRLNWIIEISGLPRAAIARETPITPRHLSRLLRAEQCRLSQEREQAIERAVEHLCAETHKQARAGCISQARQDPQGRVSYWRTRSLDLLITECRVKRVDLAREAGITPTHLARLLREKSAPLHSSMERNLYQALDRVCSERERAILGPLDTRIEELAPPDRESQDLQAEIRRLQGELAELRREYRHHVREWNRHSAIDWEDNRARTKRVSRLVKDSRVSQASVARYLGITQTWLSRVLRGRAYMTRQMEKDLHHAAAALGQMRRIELNRKLAAWLIGRNRRGRRRTRARSK